MKWNTDPMKYEKQILFDGIIQFSKEFEGKKAHEISIKQLAAFVDKYFNPIKE